MPISGKKVDGGRGRQSTGEVFCASRISRGAYRGQRCPMRGMWRDSETGCPEAIPYAQYLISDIQPAEGFGGKLVASPTQAVQIFSATGCPEAIPYAQYLISVIRPEESFGGKLVASPVRAEQIFL